MLIKKIINVRPYRLALIVFSGVLQIFTWGHSIDHYATARTWRLPIGMGERNTFDSIIFESDSHFLSPRRGGYLHPAIDLIPAQKDGENNRVFSAASGKVVSVYAVEPYKSVMIKHTLPNERTVYTVYVHVTNIRVKAGDLVDINTHIADLMNNELLKVYGHQFSHLHFEILKKPRAGDFGKILSYSTRCQTVEEVFKHYYDPVKFFKAAWQSEN